MDPYPPSYSYPDSGNSSPRSREVDFDNAPPPTWEDHPLSAAAATVPPSYKVKFLVSYGGKIQPRSHDHLLSYIGGDTKILAVDRSVKFATMYSKLYSLFTPAAGETPAAGFTVKYQLPGEDLDALISVTNDDDLEHMMHEYDRMWRGSTKSVRLRLFLFNDVHQQWRSHSGDSVFSSIESETGKLGGEPDIGPVDELISNQQRQRNDVVLDPPPTVVSPPVHNNVDFLFGLDKGPVHEPVPVPVHHEPVHEAGRFQVPVQELHQFQLREQQQQPSAMYYRSNDENLEDPYQKSSVPANLPTKIPATAQIPAGYWQQMEQHPPQQPLPQLQQQQQYPPQLQQQQQYPPQLQQQQQQYHPPPQQQPVYMMHAPPQGGVYHAPIMQGQIQPTQGYYQQPMYRAPAPAGAAPVTIPATSVASLVRPGMVGETMGYQQMAYDGASGRQVYYAAAPLGSGGGGIVAPPFPGVMGAVAATAVGGGGEMRSSGDGKGVLKGVNT